MAPLDDFKVRGGWDGGAVDVAFHFTVLRQPLKIFYICELIE